MKQAILLGVTTAATPSAPVWPKAFTQSFNETVGANMTTGQYFYDVRDANNTMTRIDRKTGQHDNFCKGGIYEDTPCSHYVVNGDRYIYKPLHDDCCYCCSADHGCGVKSTDWMKDYQYQSTKNVDGYNTYWWSKSDVSTNHENMYYETVDEVIGSRIPARVEEWKGNVTEYTQDWIHNSFYPAVAKGVFRMPPACNKEKVCPSASMCSKARGESVGYDSETIELVQ